MAYSKYKDAPPDETIERIKKCFSKIGVNLRHTVSKRMEGIYSSVVFDEIGGWATAGKGTSELFCLASGYAEAMEHFCNYCAYDVSKIDKNGRNYLNFNRYPDEIVIDKSQIRNIDERVLNEMKQAYSIEGDICDDSKLADTWSEFLDSDNISLVPYYSVKKKTTVYLPEAIIGKLCGSTGGGAGNTVEEAIGHGLDEISERYVKYVIYSKELTPPEITQDFIEKVCPDLFQIIVDIQNDEKYSIIVLDASLGKKYPVVAVCLINQFSHSYVVNFGAHPCFPIALERCLTEMFQFMSLGQEKSIKHKNLEKWTSFDDDVHTVRNWTSLLRDDTGKVPNAFFVGNPSWQFEPWGLYEDYSNKYGVKLQINNFLQDGAEDIFIRDFSFLGFPVYRVYIPDYSSSHYTICDRILKDYENGKNIMNAIVTKNKCTLTMEEGKMLQKVFSHNSYIDSWIIRDVKETYFDLLYAFLVKDLLCEEEAFELINSIDDDFSSALREEQHMAYLNKSVMYRDRSIELFYGCFISKIIKAWRKDNSFIHLCLLLKKYGLIKARQTNNATAIENLQLVHQRFKEAMLKNIPDQMFISNFV